MSPDGRWTGRQENEVEVMFGGREGRRREETWRGKAEKVSI